MEQKIYVNFPIPETINEFIKLLYCYPSITLTALETYSDEACTIEETPCNKWRSFDDLMILINTYYPGTAEKDLIHELICADIRSKNGREHRPYMMLCGFINKSTISYHTVTRGASVFMDDNGNSKYSWRELLLLLGITNDKELNEYIEANKKSS